jgi:hypothetical protein
MRSDALSAAAAIAAVGGEIALIELVRIPALNSVGLCIAVWLVAIMPVRVRRTVKVLRRVRATHWRSLDSAWTYVELRERSAGVLLRDPETGEQAALHVQRLPSRKAMPTDVLLPVWFAGELTSDGVIAPAGGGPLMFARTFRTAIARRDAFPRTIHEELTVPLIPPQRIRDPAMRSSLEWEYRRERARLQKRVRDRISVYDSFDLQRLRSVGHVPKTKDSKDV